MCIKNEETRSEWERENIGFGEVGRQLNYSVGDRKRRRGKGGKDKSQC